MESSAMKMMQTPFEPTRPAMGLLKVLALACVASASFAGPFLAGDGVTEINQARASAGGVTTGDAPGFPVTLSHRGSYILTSNLVVMESGGVGTCGPMFSPGSCAIDITSNDVALDLNGFTIVMDVERGIVAYDYIGTAVANGTVRGAFINGVMLGSSCRIDNIRAINNSGVGAGEKISAIGNCTITGNIATGSTDSGIAVFGNGCTITGNTVTNNGQGITVFGSGCTISGNSVDQNNNNGSYGIFVDGSCAITGNTVTNHGGAGIIAGNGSVIRSNTARANGGFGLQLAADAGYAGNVLTENNGGSANAQVSGGVEIGTNLCGTNTTCP